MHNSLKNAKGFTLLEILVVVVILATLAGLATPMYTKSLDSSKRAEAVAVLGSVRSSEVRYFQENATYTTLFSNLDYDPTVAASYAPDQFASRKFNYVINTGNTTALLVTATLISAPTKTVTINEAGVVAYSGF